MRLSELVAVSRAVAETGSRLRKVERLADFLALVPAGELETAVAFLTGAPRQGRIGVGLVVLREARSAPAAAEPALELPDVDRIFGEIASLSGSGSNEARVAHLRHLLRAATPAEQDFLTRLLFGELRQGALEGVVVEAVARAASVPADLVRRAAMLAGSLPQIARVALTEGGHSLAGFLVQPFRPIQPMLADSAADVDAAVGELGEALFEYKLDGARIQLHKSGHDVKIYSRNLRDVTAVAPEIVAAARTFPAREIILDGEAIALRPDGMPHPFQTTMRRFGRRRDVDRLLHELPISAFFFDALYLDGASLIDEPLARRAAVLAGAVPGDNRVPGTVTAGKAEAAAFAARARAAGHEGVMAKALSAPYAAGRRGSAWLKVKEATTLDLVVLAAEWGSGRRRGTLSNLHLGARDAERGGFVMLGKTFKGLTDALLAWQTRRFLELELARDEFTVFVRPELVVEIAFNDIQASPQYPGGLALRFARVKRYRPDKPAAEADLFSTVQELYRTSTGLPPPLR